MPHIRVKRADVLDPHIDKLAPLIYEEGELTYVYSRLAAKYVHKRGFSYAILSDAYKTLLVAAAEFHRHVIVPYEDAKARDSSNVSVEEVYGE